MICCVHYAPTLVSARASRSGVVKAPRPHIGRRPHAAAARVFEHTQPLRGCSWAVRATSVGSRQAPPARVEQETQLTSAANVDVEQETRALLEWNAICAQVAAFASTPIGDISAKSGLKLGSTRAQSENLLDETDAALAFLGSPSWQAASDALRGVRSVLADVEAAVKGADLTGAQLVGVGAALRSARLLRAALRDGNAGAPLQALAEDLRGAEMRSRGPDGSSSEPSPASSSSSSSSAAAAAAGDVPPAAPQSDVMVETALERIAFQSLSDPVGAVLDTASPELASIRARRADSARELMQLLTQLSQRLERAKASERAQVVSRRDRLAIPIKAGMTGSVPGCVVLDTSASGATLFVEPPDAIVLNNLQAELEVAEEEEETRILEDLTDRVRRKKTTLRVVLRAVADIDLAFARARYAQWMGSARPAFAEPQQPGMAQAQQGGGGGAAAGAAAGAAVWLPALRNPLLLAASLEPPALRHWEEDTPLLVAEMRRGTYLAPPPPPEEQQGRPGGGPSSFSSARPGQPQAGSKVKGDPFWSPAKPGAPAASVSALSADSDDDESEGGAPTTELGPVTLGNPPKPIDVTVPAGARVVVISGPNAGGKTASMKALALAALMARAGLFVPAAQGCVVPWASRVMADLGDSQSLEGGLSTFSGHVARLTRILNALRPQPQGPLGGGAGASADSPAATAADSAPSTSGRGAQQAESGKRKNGADAAEGGGGGKREAPVAAEEGASIVLLDEPGGGTDPKEGAALATALLECLADRASLTIATSHYEEAKELALGGDTRFVNASVEFDTATLQPKYRLLWGAFGSSYALSVARTIGLDPKVLTAAEAALEEMAPATAARRSSELRARLEELLRVQSELAAASAAKRAAAEQVAAEAAAAAAEVVPKEKDLIAELEAKAAEAEAAARAAFNDIAQLAEADEAGVSELFGAELAERLPQGWELSSMGTAVPSSGTRGGSAGGRGGAEGNSAGDAGVDGALWGPAIGDTVSVKRLGARPATVVEIGSDGWAQIRLGQLVTRVAVAELTRYDGDGDEPAARKSASQSLLEKRVSRRKGDSGFISTGGASAGGVAGKSSSGAVVAIQTAENTVDVRGEYAAEAVAKVEVAAGARSANRSGPSTLFVIHGMGTGRLKEAIWEAMKRKPYVLKVEQSDQRNGGAGCTVLYLK